MKERKKKKKRHSLVNILAKTPEVGTDSFSDGYLKDGLNECLLNSMEKPELPYIGVQ